MTGGIRSKFREWLGVSNDVDPGESAEATFLLVYGELVIGTLSYSEGRWKFEYTEEFKERDDLRPLFRFRDKNEKYEQEDLWQFFMSRIPSAERTDVEEVVLEEEIDERDLIKLLETFGRRTSANPYELRIKELATN